MNTALNVATALFALGATAVTLIALLAWRRSRRPRMGLLALGFAWFAAAGIVTAVGLFTDQDVTDLLTWQTALSAAGILSLYLAAVKR